MQNQYIFIQQDAGEQSNGTWLGKQNSVARIYPGPILTERLLKMRDDLAPAAETNKTMRHFAERR